jgi:hypothetical protein
MKVVASALLALSLLAGIAATSAQADTRTSQEEEKLDRHRN